MSTEATLSNVESLLTKESGRYTSERLTEEWKGQKTRGCCNGGSIVYLYKRNINFKDRRTVTNLDDHCVNSFTLGPFLFSYSKYLNNVEETVGVCTSLLAPPDCAFFFGLNIPMERHLPRPVLRLPARINTQSSALGILRNHNGDCRRIFLVLYS